MLFVTPPLLAKSIASTRLTRQVIFAPCSNQYDNLSILKNDMPILLWQPKKPIFSKNLPAGLFLRNETTTAKTGCLENPIFR